MRRIVAAAACALACLSAPVAAQQPDSTRPRADTARADSLRAAPPAADSVRPLPDSLNPDALRPPLPALGPPPGPLPSRQRVVFGRDEIDWLGARSLGELLAFVPGAFLVRPGWYGAPEFIGYAGQGAAGLELYVDGFLLTPLGEDSSALDLNRFDIGLARRIEVEVLPTVLRVYLVSDVGTVRRPRTEASFGTGDAETNTYRGRYLNRWASGAGLTIAASYFATDGSGGQGEIAGLTVHAKGTWTPSPLVGVEYSFTTRSLERDATAPSDGGPPIPAINARRRDAFARAFAATRPDGYGLRFDAIFGTSNYSDSAGTLDVTEAQAAAITAWRGARASLEATTRLRSGRTPFFAQLRGALAPLRSLTLSGSVQTARRLGDQRDLEASGHAELRLLRGIHLFGSARWRDLIADTTQTVLDWNGGLGLRLPGTDLDVSVQRHQRFRAPPLQTLSAQIAGATTLDVTTLTAAYRFRPWNWLTVHGWYRHPLDDLYAAWEPPHHTRVAFTFRSRFLPQFRRGIFDVLVQAEVEGWGDGVIGTDGAGAPLRLEGATVANYTVEFRLVGAILYWTFRNPQFERYALIQGFDMPRGLQRFGVRWEFTN